MEISIKSLVGTSIVVALFGIFFYIQKKDFDPVEFNLKSPPELKGPLKVNTLLRNAQLLVKGKILGPESLVVEGNTIYTGTWDGKLVKIVNGAIEKSLKIRPGKEGHTCGTYDTEPKCGRPLGIRRLNQDEFVVAEAYSGLYSVNFEKEIVKQLFSADKPIDGSKCAFINDLDVLDNRTVIFSDSSTKWDRRRFLHDFLNGKSLGRVIRLDLETGEIESLLSGLGFANGVQIHPDRQSFLVSECSRARITRYYFDGPKKGRREIFAENLPGFPDNIRLSSSAQSFLIGLASVRHAEEMVPFMDLLGPHPFIRWALVQLIPERYLASMFTLMGKKYGFVLELDLEGNSIRSYQDPTGTVIPDVSQASDDNDYLYLGSFHSDFITKVPKKGK